jgi:hypothetical protein
MVVPFFMSQPVERRRASSLRSRMRVRPGMVALAVPSGSTNRVSVSMAKLLV